MNKGRTRQIVTITTSLVVGGILGWVGISLVARVTFLRRMLDQIAQLPDILVVLLPIPVILLVIFVHELGHLAGGLSGGMRFLLLVVGPFQWTKSAVGVSFSWNLKPALMGGLAAALPDRQRLLSPQLLRLVVGGPLASLLMGAGSIILAGQVEGLLTPVLLMAGLFSLTIFLVTATPFRAGGFQSDGWQLIELLRGDAAVAERQLILEILGVSLSGVRPRDWEVASMSRLANLESSELLRSIAARTQALYHYWDRGEIAEVESLAKWLDGHLEQYPDGFRQAVHLELALLAHESNYQADFDRHLLLAKGGIVDRPRRLLLEATQAFRGGQSELALRKIESARQARRRGMDPGLNLMTTDQLDRLEAKVGAALVQADS